MPFEKSQWVDHNNVYEVNYGSTLQRAFKAHMPKDKVICYAREELERHGGRRKDK